MDQILIEKMRKKWGIETDFVYHKAIFTLSKFMAKIILKMPAELTMAALALTTLGN